MKRVSLIIVLLFCLTGIASFAQGDARSRSIYGELLGASQGIGVNYDARFRLGAPDGFGWRSGLGLGYAYSTNFVAFNVVGDEVETYNQMFRLAVPVEVNYLLGKGMSKLESGIGAALSLNRYLSDTGAKPKNSFGASPYASLGYRLVATRGFLFRAGLLYSGSFYPYLGFGWAF